MEEAEKHEESINTKMHGIKTKFEQRKINNKFDIIGLYLAKELEDMDDQKVDDCLQALIEVILQFNDKSFI